MSKMSHLLILYSMKTSQHQEGTCAVEAIAHWSDFASKLAERYPGYKVPSFPKDTTPGLLKSLIDAVENLKSKGASPEKFLHEGGILNLSFTLHVILNWISFLVNT